MARASWLATNPRSGNRREGAVTGAHLRILLARFAREIKLAAALQEPHIVPIISAGQTVPAPVLSMPFVRGSRCATLLQGLFHSRKPDPCVSLRARLRPPQGSCTGTSNREHTAQRGHGRRHGLRNREAVIAARRKRRHHSAGRLRRTRGTCLPSRRPPIRHRSAADIYAWGVVAYELISGKHPSPKDIASSAAHRADVGYSTADIATNRKFASI